LWAGQTEVGEICGFFESYAPATVHPDLRIIHKAFGNADLVFGIEIYPLFDVYEVVFVAVQRDGLVMFWQGIDDPFGKILWD
jgi:hypothetical protein